MTVYLVSYDLKKPMQNYQGLYDVLKKASGWWHYLESTWIIASSETIETWQGRLKNTMDDNDSFIIVELPRGTRRAGWLPQKAWDWLKENLERLG